MTEDKTKIVVIGGAVSSLGLSALSADHITLGSVQVVDPFAQPDFNTFNNRRDVRDPRRNFKSVNKPQQRIKRGRR